jgi:hypothetical protein
MNLTTEQQAVIDEVLAPGYDHYPFFENAWNLDEEDLLCEDALYWLKRDFPGYEDLSVTYDGENDDEVFDLRGEFVSVLGREHTHFTNLSQLQKDIIQSSQDGGCRTITMWWDLISESVDKFLESRGINQFAIQDIADEEGWEEEWLDTIDKVTRVLWDFGDDGYYFKDKHIQLITP